MQNILVAVSVWGDEFGTRWMIVQDDNCSVNREITKAVDQCSELSVSVLIYSMCHTYISHVSSHSPPRTYPDSYYLWHYKITYFLMFICRNTTKLPLDRLVIAVIWVSHTIILFHPWTLPQLLLHCGFHSLILTLAFLWYLGMMRCMLWPLFLFFGIYAHIFYQNTYNMHSVEEILNLQ